MLWIVDTPLVSDKYHVCSQVGIGPSILLLSRSISFNHVKDDHDDGISPLIVLLFNLNVFKFLNHDHDDGSVPVRLTDPKFISTILDIDDHDDGSVPATGALFNLIVLILDHQLDHDDGNGPVILGILPKSR